MTPHLDKKLTWLLEQLAWTETQPITQNFFKWIKWARARIAELELEKKLL